MKAELKVEGMRCENCSARLQRALLACAGVKEAEVSLSDKCAIVTFDEQQISTDSLKTIVDDCGFEVVD